MPADDAAPTSDADPAPAGGSGPDRMEQVVNLAKRRGFVFPSAEIYGASGPPHDYGPIGVLLLRNVKDVVALDGAAPRRRGRARRRRPVAAGGLGGLGSPRQLLGSDGRLPQLQARHRADDIPDPDTCPTCGATGTFTEARQFNLMFKTHAGPVEEDAAIAYLRPGDGPGIFVNFGNVLQASRKKPPFGIAQIGKSFRNEITPATSSSAPASSSRWRWSTSSAEEAPCWFSTGASSGSSGGRRARHRPRPPAPAVPRPRRAEPLQQGTSDVEYLFPWGGASSRASPTAARTT